MQILAVCSPEVWPQGSTPPTLPRPASKGPRLGVDPSSRYVLANCRANIVVVEDQRQLAKILEVGDTVLARIQSTN